MSKANKAPISTIAKSNSMEPAKDSLTLIPPSNSTIITSADSTTALSVNSIELRKNEAPQLRSKITLIPSPSRSPRPLILDSPVDAPKISFLKTVDEIPSSKSVSEIPSLKSTEETSEKPKAADDIPAAKLANEISDLKITENSPKSNILDEIAHLKAVDEEPQTLKITSPLSSSVQKTPESDEPSCPKASVTSPTLSNTDTIYSGRASSSTRRLTSPDWSENFETNKTAVPTVVENQKPKTEEICKTSENTGVIKKELKENLFINSKTPEKKEIPEKQKTLKISKIGISFGNNKSHNTVVPSPKIKPSTILKKSSGKFF